MTSLEDLIKTVEECQSVPKAAEKIGLTRQAVWDRLNRHGYTIVVVKSLKVVRKA
jgi:biotin operon repressor